MAQTAAQLVGGVDDGAADGRAQGIGEDHNGLGEGFHKPTLQMWLRFWIAARQPATVNAFAVTLPLPWHHTAVIWHVRGFTETVQDG